MNGKISLPAIPQHSVADIEVMAKQVAASRLFGLDPAQAFTLMLLAQSRGLHPIQAVERFHIIKGRPAMKAEAMLAEFQARGGSVEWTVDTDTEVEGVFRHPVHAPKGNVSRFTLADAKRAELLGNEVWRKFPNNMLHARVITNGIKKTMPGIIAGIFTEEDVADLDDRQWSQEPACETTAVEASPAIETAVPAAKRKDPRRFHRFISDGVDRANAEFRAEHFGAEDIVGRTEVGRYVLGLLIARGYLDDPGAVSDGKVEKLLDETYGHDGHYSWMRRAVKDFLDARTLEAREKAKQEAETMPDAPGDGKVEDWGDEDAPSGVGAGAPASRDPGEEG